MMIGLMGMMGVVMADAATQGAEITVQADLSSFVATPNPIPFGNLIPGAESIQSITLTPGTSNLAITVAITGDALIQGILSDRVISGTYVVYQGDAFGLTANTPLIFNTKIVVPSPFPAGAYTGTVTYTVLEAI